MKVIRLGVLTACAFAAALATAAAQTSGRIVRESVDSLGGEALGDSGRPALSADGRFVAFHSDAADLIPGDTNQNTDVFVRDRETGVVQRVSVAWNGMEARDDSWCPSLSSDGRFVAFLSQAWNMYPGGANLGSPRRDVYLHDRQSGTTLRVSRTAGGGDPDGDSGCPSLSGDGQRVVFESAATNLSEHDGNESQDVYLYDRATDEVVFLSPSAAGGPSDGASRQPAISRDGTTVAFVSTASDLLPAGAPHPPQPPLGLYLDHVYVREIDTGTIELASRALLHPQVAPSGRSVRPAISGDGRFVAFESTANNLVFPNPPGLVVYVYDREVATTVAAGVPDPASRSCGLDDQGFCHWGTNHAAAISDDGRFVSYSSGSDRLLPANPSAHGSDIYLFDRIGGRLRRVSVDATGWQGEGCSEEATLSADGRLVAFRSAAANLVPGDGNARDDVLSSEWSCVGERCRTLATCPAVPPSCAPAGESVLRLAKRAPGGVKADTLFWRWAGEELGEPFPDPAGSGRYQLCMYGRSLALDVVAEPGPACDGSGGPCWRPIARGYRLIDPRGGLTSLRLTRSGGKPRILARGTGPLLDAPYLPLAAPQGIVVQLQETATGRCWGAEFPATAIKRNVAGKTAIGGERNGRLVARVR